MLRRTSAVSLMTVAILVVPFGGLLVLLYGAARITADKRRGDAAHPYGEGLTL